MSLLNNKKASFFNWRDWKYPLLLFFFWRAAIFLVSWLTSPRYGKGYCEGENLGWKTLAAMLHRWDGGHYLGIAQFGYSSDPNETIFYPLFPALIRVLGRYFHFGYHLAALIIVTVALIFCLYYFYKLVRLDYDALVAKRSLFFLLIFPSAFFLAAFYTEPLFLCLIIASFYYARVGRWWLAGAIGFFAALTRQVGVFLFFGLLVEYLYQRQFKFQEIKKDIISLLLIPAGLLAYLTYLKIHFGSFWLAQQVGSSHWGAKLEMINQPLARILHILNMAVANPDLLADGYYLQHLTYLLFFIITVLAIVFIAIYLRPSYAIFSVLIVLPLFIVSNQLVSIQRYLLPMFPMFILLALWSKKSELIYQILILISILFMGVFNALFVNCYYIT